MNEDLLIDLNGVEKPKTHYYWMAVVGCLCYLGFLLIVDRQSLMDKNGQVDFDLFFGMVFFLPFVALILLLFKLKAGWAISLFFHLLMGLTSLLLNGLDSMQGSFPTPQNDSDVRKIFLLADCLAISIFLLKNETKNYLKINKELRLTVITFALLAALTIYALMDSS